MIITHLELRNFRTYEKLSIKLGKNMNIFIGDNAQGKTNILESIVVLSLTKSFRDGIEENLIKFGREKAFISGKIRNESVIHDLKVTISKKEKELFIDNHSITKFADYISNLAIILFTPDDLEIVKGTPSLRRNLLNMELSQLSAIYLKTYNEYNKLLKTRNEYLKILYLNSIADKSYLDVLTDKLISKAVTIYQMRNEYLNKINNYLKDIYQKITSLSNLKIIYLPNIDLGSYTDEEITNAMKRVFKVNFKKELAQGMTLYGPHRDDFVFFLDEKDLKLYGSEGQKRLAFIAYKLSTIPIFKEKLHTDPVLLLDDIFSEIDKKKQNKLLQYIMKGSQCIITTTSLNGIQKKYLEDAKIFKVQHGVVSVESGE